MRVPRLDVLKTLGDNTRYAIYLELARSPRPLATADIAEGLGLHANTVRPHLERMRDVGLLEVGTHVATGVGRPHHVYWLAADAPALGLEPPTFPLLARLLVELAERAGAAGAAAAEVGRAQGSASSRNGQWVNAITAVSPSSVPSITGSKPSTSSWATSASRHEAASV